MDPERESPADIEAARSELREGIARSRQLVERAHRLLDRHRTEDGNRASEPGVLSSPTASTQLQ